MKTTDLRKYARQTTFRLTVGALMAIFFVGDGLIFLFYGKGAALTGLLCLAGGLFPVIFIIAALWILEWIVKRANQE